MTTAVLTLDQVAERLQVSRRTVDRLCKAGMLRPIRVLGSPRVTDRELDAYIASQEGRKRR